MSVISRLEAAGVVCHTRRDWGSPRERDGSYAHRVRTHPMPPGPAPYHFLHITVTRDTDTILEGASGARQIESFGYSTPPMVSYQDLVTNEGRYFQGQNYGVKGTHTVNDKEIPGYPTDLNRYGYATALMQNVDDAVTDAQVRVVAMTMAARELEGLVRRGAPILPHRKFAWKACPGDKAVARLPEIIRLKNQYVRVGLPGQRIKEPGMNDVQEGRVDLNAAITSLRKAIDHFDDTDKSRRVVWQQLAALRTALGILVLARKIIPQK